MLVSIYPKQIVKIYGAPEFKQEALIEKTTSMVSTEDLELEKISLNQMRKWLKYQKETHDNLNQKIELHNLTNSQSQLITNMEKHTDELLKYTSQGARHWKEHKEILIQFNEDIAKFENDILYFANPRIYFNSIGIIGLLMLRFN